MRNSHTLLLFSAHLKTAALVILMILQLALELESSTTWTSSPLDKRISDMEIDEIPATYHGIDTFTEPYSESKATGTDYIDQYFYLCYHKDGRKTYYKKQNPASFLNKRYWIITASGKFLVSMFLC